MVVVSRAKTLRLFRHRRPEPLRDSELEHVDSATAIMTRARNTTIGLFSRRLRDGADEWDAEIPARKAIASAFAYIIYGEFGRARDILEAHPPPATSHMSLFAMQPEFLLMLIEARDFRRAAVLAHQARERAYSRRLDGDPIALFIREQWDSYALVADVLAGRRPTDDLDEHLASVTSAYLEVVARWARATHARRCGDAAAFEAASTAYRELAPYCVSPEEAELSSPVTVA